MNTKRSLEDITPFYEFEYRALHYKIYGGYTQ